MKSTWWWRALGGPAATSWPILIIPIVIAIPTAFFNARVWQMPSMEAALGQFVGAAFMIATLVIARVSWLSPHRLGTPRSVAAALTFACASVMRLVGMALVFAGFGVIGDWPVVVSVLSGGIGQAIILGFGSIAVNALRGHAQTMARLESVGRRIVQARSLTLEEIRSIQREVADEVLASARAVLDAARTDADARVVSDRVQRAAVDVVRPASHSLNSGDAVADRVFQPDQKVRWRSVIAKARPSAPVLGPILYELLVLGTVWGAYGPEVAALNLAVAPPILIAANLLLVGVWRQGLLGRWTVMWIVLASTLANILALIAVITLSGVLGRQTQDLVVGFGIYPAAMLIGSVLLSVVERQSETEQSLAVAVEEEARAMGDALQLAQDERYRLARVMHGEVQAELTAAVARLKLIEAADQDAVEEVLDDLTRRLDRVDLSGSVGRDQTLMDLWETWSLAIPLDVSVSAEAQRVIESDVRVQRRLVAVASEAITNAVRHGAQEGVSVDIELAGQSVTIEVRNVGLLDVRQSGLGTREIDEFAESWSVSQDGNEVVLTAAVRVPLLAV